MIISIMKIKLDVFFNGFNQKFKIRKKCKNNLKWKSSLKLKNVLKTLISEMKKTKIRFINWAMFMNN